MEVSLESPGPEDSVWYCVLKGARYLTLKRSPNERAVRLPQSCMLAIPHPAQSALLHPS